MLIQHIFRFIIPVFLGVRAYLVLNEKYNHLRDLMGQISMLSSWRVLQTFVFLLLCFLVNGCEGRNRAELPVLSEVTREFSFHNQDDQEVSLAVFTDKVYVADFFFTTCPSICPVMKRQMIRVHDAFRDNPDLLLFSHTIDPEHDTVEVLKNFANGLGVATAKWQMVTGSQEEIFAMAKHYMVGAMKNKEAPGGYIHSGSFILVDKNKKIRGYYNGTSAEDVDRLILDLKQLLKQQ